MVIENTLQPFSQWIVPAFISWALIVAALICAVILLGLFVAVVRNGPTRGFMITILAILDGIVDIVCMSPGEFGG